jgi:hypothetical protein
VGTPTIRILFAIFIRENGLEGAPMEIEVQHIATSEGRLRCGGQKQFIHHPITQNPDRRFGGRSRRVGSHNETNTGPFRLESHIRTIEKGTACSTLRMKGLLIWWLLETGLNGRPIKQGVVFVSYNDSHPQQEELEENGSGPIQAI